MSLIYKFQTQAGWHISLFNDKLDFKQFKIDIFEADLFNAVV